MNCDECQEQVFELIEREAVDPDGVREILSQCPDCRVAFDEMKAALAVAEQLPIEEPSPALDAAILRAAGERAPGIVPLRNRRLQTAPWAMAAIALLAVGVGVWTIPREVQLEGDAAPAELKNAGEAILAERMLEDEAEALDGRIAQVELASEGTTQLRTVEPPDAKLQKEAPEPARAKRKSRPSSNEPSAAPVTQAPASLPAADTAVGGVAKSAAYEAAPEAARAHERARDDDHAAATCKRKVADIEGRTRADKDYAPTPEDELAIGKCYQVLRNVAEARKWLQRAAAHRKTKARAEKALLELAPE
jgi:hypothetical protein